MEYKTGNYSNNNPLISESTSADKQARNSDSANKSKKKARTVCFYRAYLPGEKKYFDPRALYDELAKLSFDDDSAYLYAEDKGVRFFAKLASSKGVMPVRLWFGKTNVDVLQPLEKKGVVRNPEADEDEGSLHQCHIAFFEEGIVAAESTRIIPSLDKLGVYLKNKCPDLSTVEFYPCIEKGGYKKVEQAAEITGLKFSLVREQMGALVENAPSMAHVAEALEKTFSGDQIKLEVTQLPKSASQLHSKAFGILKEIFGKTALLRTDDVEVKLRSKPGSRAKWFDIASHWIKDDRVYAKTINRKIDSDSLFEEIEKSCRYNWDDLRNSVMLRAPDQ